MTTRSAFGTAAIIRRLVISRMRARTLPLTSALPSSSLCSCFSSWWLIFRRSAYRRFCSGTSTSGESGRARAAAAPCPRRASRPPAAIAAGSGIASDADERVDVARQPERADRAEDEREHARLQRIDQPAPWRKPRPRPASGLSASNLGPSGLKVQVQPPSRSAPATATRHHGEPERQHRPEQRRRPAEQLRGHRVVAERLRAVEAERARERVLQPAPTTAARPRPARRRRRRSPRSGRGRASGRPGLPRAPSRACAARREDSCPGRSSRPCGRLFRRRWQT